MGKDVIIACDFPTADKMFGFLRPFEGRNPYLKIGMELYYAEGAPIVRELKKRGFRIFLDLKLHDIPNTVASAMKVLAGLGVDIINVHAAGGRKMMAAAKEAVSTAEKPPVLIGVTQLTSTSEEMLHSELLIEKSMEDTVISYAKNAKAAGLGGVVCSPLEAGLIHKACGNEFLTVTPGIRFAENDKGDQTRVTTPAMAKQLGSDYIVVGRSITGAADPLKAYERCVNDFC